MNLGINGLYKLVSQEMDLPPLSGAVFIFFSKNRQQVKLLRWDTDGFTLYHATNSSHALHQEDIPCGDDFDAKVIVRLINFLYHKNHKHKIGEDGWTKLTFLRVACRCQTGSHVLFAGMLMLTARYQLL